MGSDGAVREEPVDGGRDVRSSSDSAAAHADHLVVMVHGILGSNSNWKYAADQFVASFPDKVIVHCSERNMNKSSLDGVDVMGERLSDEVIEVVNRWAGIRKISFIAHSLGGLVARYAIGKLYRPPKRKSDLSSNEGGEISKGTIYGLEAINFITVATPHLGSRGNKQVPFLFGLPVLEKTASYVIHWIFGKTGKHLFFTDCDYGQLPLLRRMVIDYGSLHFMSALRAFRRRVAYSNVCYDHIVGWRTSSMRRNSELPNWGNPSSDKYPHVVYEEYLKEEDTADTVEKEQFPLRVGCLDDLEEELLKGLRKVSWEKVDVSFHNSRQRFAAHSIIQVKDSFWSSEGADVIQHMMDRFIT